MKTRIARTLVVVIVALAAVAVAACGDDESEAGDSGKSETHTLRVTSLPILDAAPYFWALDTGLFEKHNLVVKDQTSAGGAADLPALVSGDLDLAFSNSVSAMLAEEQGLPIRIVTGTNENRPESLSKEDFVAIVTAPGSDIKSPKQLAGKKMAVNTLNNINHLFERAWLESEGVDPDSVEFLEVPFPDQPLALERGQVDATMIGAPFLQSLTQDGAKVLGYPYRVLPKVTVATFIGTEKFVNENPEAAAAFRAALDEANEQVDDPANRERLLDLLNKRTKIDKATLEKALLPVFTTDVDVNAMNDIAQLMNEHGLIEESPDVESMIVQAQ